MKRFFLVLTLLALTSVASSQMKVIDDWNTPVTGDKPIKLKAPKDAPPDDIPNDIGPGANVRNRPIDSRDLSANETTMVNDLMCYLKDEIRSLKRLQDTKAKPDPSLQKAIDRLQTHLGTLQGVTFRKAGIITNTLGPDAYAAYTVVSPSSIYLTDKFFERNNTPYDDPALAKVKMQLFLAERLSLLMHELGHAGKLNYLIDSPAKKEPFADDPDSEVQLRKDMGTGDNDCYLAQYYIMRVLMDQAKVDFKSLETKNYVSTVLVAVLTQLRELGVIQFTGDPADADVLIEAMRVADLALAFKYGISVPNTFGRKVADPPMPPQVASATPAGTPGPTAGPDGRKPSPSAGASPSPKASAVGSAGGKKMTDAEYGAAVAGAWNEVVALSIAEKNAKSADGTSYRLEWVAKFAYCRKNNLDQIAGAYCMWQKSPNQKEYKAFVYGGEKEADVGYMQVGVAAAGVSQWNQEHPGQKVKLPDRPAD